MQQRLPAATRAAQAGKPPPHLFIYTSSGINGRMKPLKFIGSSLDDLRKMPASVRHTLGIELMTIQYGGNPSNFKPMKCVGAGAYEIRHREPSGAFRVIYVAKQDDAVYVLHAFQKKSQKTTKNDIDLAAKRYKLIGEAL
ncbi:type II toxin-antitoxin system RelE/ParE family toxin [Thiorhodospira sibirica]|uniref:type II toxin-antitoxin system RelE/ParE family toxin n=1 Tax=Thiorhodospira sibirica TaxID=154347 RepID=UPI001FEC794F|nr:type II toxin-antitoxin system RelE/ParE family toxin [Thiorhodospira sibirica]